MSVGYSLFIWVEMTKFKEGYADRRASPRMLVDLEVNIDSSDNYLLAHILDISETGIFVRTTSPEQKGTQLNVRFTTENGSPFELEGEVMWVNPFRPSDADNIDPGMGIRFLDMTDEKRGVLRRLIKRTALIDREDMRGDDIDDVNKN